MVKSHTTPFFETRFSSFIDNYFPKCHFPPDFLLLQKCVGKCQVRWLTHIKVCNHAGCESRDHTCTKQFANLHFSMTSGTKCLQDTPASDSPYCFWSIIIFFQQSIISLGVVQARPHHEMAFHLRHALMYLLSSPQRCSPSSPCPIWCPFLLHLLVYEKSFLTFIIRWYRIANIFLVLF